MCSKGLCIDGQLTFQKSKKREREDGEDLWGNKLKASKVKKQKIARKPGQFVLLNQQMNNSPEEGTSHDDNVIDTTDLIVSYFNRFKGISLITFLFLVSNGKQLEFPM